MRDQTLAHKRGEKSQHIEERTTCVYSEGTSQEPKPGQIGEGKISKLLSYPYVLRIHGHLQLRPSI